MLKFLFQLYIAIYRDGWNVNAVDLRAQSINMYCIFSYLWWFVIYSSLDTIFSIVWCSRFDLFYVNKTFYFRDAEYFRKKKVIGCDWNEKKGEKMTITNAIWLLICLKRLYIIKHFPLLVSCFDVVRVSWHDWNDLDE